MREDQWDREQTPVLPAMGAHWSKEEDTEVSELFSQALAQATEGMESEQADRYLAALFEDEAVETEHLFERITMEQCSQLPVPSYHPDRAVREASLARKDHWKSKEGGELSYVASNELEVYLGLQGQPLDISQALKEIRKLSDSTVLTARILLGLWNIRRHNKQVSKDGSVAILLDEILQWQGIQKHSRLAHPGTTKRYTDGYRIEQRQRVLQDMALLASCHVRGSCSITIRGKATQIEVDGPYMRYDIVSRKTAWGDKVILGFLVAPGGWIGTYEQHQNSSFAQIDSQVFRLNPQNDRYALRLALYLTERWREQAKEGNFSTPVVMSELLTASMIEVDRRHLTADFAPAIERALLKLEHMHILGRHTCIAGFHIGVDDTRVNTCMRVHGQREHVEAPPLADENPCLTAAEYDQARWGKEWLASRWELLPPVELIQAYQPLQTTRKKRGRKSMQKEASR